MITLSRAAADGFPALRAAAGCIRRHLALLPRYQRLHRYFAGQNDLILQKPGAAVRLPHPIARYIALLSSGYLTGRPIRLEAPDQPRALQELARALSLSASDSVDSELSLNAAVYGKGVERVYVGPDGLPHTVSLSPEEAFVVYDDTVAHRPLFGVCLTQTLSEDGRPGPVRFEVLSDRESALYEADTFENAQGASLIRREPHIFPGVPLVEYWNNFDETGDFEPVLPLIDGYDALQSARLEDKERFVDSLLVLTGCQLRQTWHNRQVIGPDGSVSQEQVPDENPVSLLRRDRLLSLPDSGASAQYLSHTFHEADTEVLRASLREDIHRLSLVPDLSDQSFSQNLSGVAMRYKLMGLEQLTAIKERWFREAFRERLRLFSAGLQALGRPAPDPETVRILFTRSLPQDEEEAARVVSLLKDVLPREALYAYLPREPAQGGPA